MEQYTILGRIGEGAHGIVFKAKNIEVYGVKNSVSTVLFIYPILCLLFFPFSSDYPFHYPFFFTMYIFYRVVK